MPQKTIEAAINSQLLHAPKTKQHKFCFYMENKKKKMRTKKQQQKTTQDPQYRMANKPVQTFLRE